MRNNLKSRCLLLIGLACILVSISWLVWNVRGNYIAKRASDHILSRLTLTEKQGFQLEEDQLPVETIDKTKYMGVLSIPTENLYLPIAADYSFEQMDKTPTRYLGSYKTDDLVICGHDSFAHFFALQNISIGSKLTLETVTGEKIDYVVTNREVIEPAAVDKVYKGAGQDDDWDLSLFTCTQSGLARVLVRCQRI
ncbi:sortase [Streptococcus gallolyticus]|uniref:sortase n=1 Tax=Streptococcus hepaticus TaxID=3349163 RepID=UPI001C94F742|nr:sortase [Streptococcus gallolyticus]MBY5042071.1 sortase [Streptococcus gallolyticus]